MDNNAFGDELTLFECLEILRATEKSNMPERAEFFYKHIDEVQDAIQHHVSLILLEGVEFKIEYFARIIPTQPYQYVPTGWIKLGANGNDPQSNS